MSDTTGQPQPTIAQQIQNNIPDPSKLATNVGQTLSDVKNTVTTSLNEFSSAKVLNAGNDFAQSNSIVAKFAFLILVVIGFMFLFRVGVVILNYFLAPSDNPYLIKGMIDGGDTGEIPQDPRSSTYGYVKPSVDGKTGAEFTYSVWISIKGNDISSNYHKRIFNKGTNTSDANSVASVNNAPGLYVRGDASGTQNVLEIYMDTVTSTNTKNTNTMTITGIPFNKWVHVAIRLQNKLLDVYVNGVLTKRTELQNMPKQNAGSVYYGGFSGKMSDLRYYSYALNVMEIARIVWMGASTETASIVSQTTTGELSRIWYQKN
jgi:hypothetical protein